MCDTFFIFKPSTHLQNVKISQLYDLLKSVGNTAVSTASKAKCYRFKFILEECLL